jgi:hypothetical protein
MKKNGCKEGAMMKDLAFLVSFGYRCMKYSVNRVVSKMDLGVTVMGKHC